MDSDFEDKCQSIAKRRKDRNVSVSKYLPPYINTPDAPNIMMMGGDAAAAPASSKQSDSGKSGNVTNNVAVTSTKVSPCRKRKISSWQRGFLSNRKKRKRERPVLSEAVEEDQVSCVCVLKSGQKRGMLW